MSPSLVEAPLEKVMSRQPVCVRADEKLDIVLALMLSCRVRHLPVVEGERMIGIVSFRDLQRASRSKLQATRGERAAHLRTLDVAQVMSRPVITAVGGETVLDGVRRLLDQRISALPVVGDGERLVGIVTRTDFLAPAATLLESERVRGEAVAVRRLMTPRPVATLRPDDSLDVAASLMHAQRIHHLPVVADDRLVGLVTDVDLLASESSCFEPLTKAERLGERHWTHVSDAMERRVLTASPIDSAAQAARLMVQRRIGCLPVVAGGRLAGMLTVTDFLYYVLSHERERAAAALPR